MIKHGTVLAGVAALLLATATPAAAGTPGYGGQHGRHHGSASVIARAAWFGEWDAAHPPAGVTYRPDLVPVGARAVVLGVSARRSVVALRVEGLRPNRDYGAHVHVATCGATGAAAGPHYQDVPDPVQPSVDPHYANPRNEIWLDFRTDRRGVGQALAHVPWRPRPGGANAVVLHEHHTATTPGAAGSAGARLACLTVPF